MGGEHVVSQCVDLIGAARVLEVPVLVSERYPEGIGHTVPELRALVVDAEVIRKDHFSCFSEPGLASRFMGDGRRTLVVAGMESHVCVMQTALEAKVAGLDVLLVTDAVGSRRPGDRDTALQRMRDAGIVLVTREMIIFEWAQRGGTDTFRELHRRFLR